MAPCPARNSAAALQAALLATSILALLTVPQSGSAATREWASSVSGLWDAPLRWSPADVPDTTAESAEFSVFGTYNVSVTAGATTQVGGFDVVRGDVAFRPTDLVDATLDVQGDANIGGDVEFAELAGGRFLFNATGALTLESAARLQVDAGAVNAASVDIASGTSVTPTVLELLDGATGEFGDTTVGSGAGGSAATQLTLLGGSSIGVDDLTIGTGNPDTAAEVQLLDSSLTQAAGGFTTIGQDRVLGSVGDATLALLGATGGLDLRDVTIRETGQLIVVDSSYTVADRLLVDGGVVDERSATTRTLGATADLTVQDGGEWKLASQTLSIGADQTLTLNAGSISGTSTVSVVGDVLVTGAEESSVDPAVTLAAAGSIRFEAGATARFGSAFTNEGGELDLAASASAIFEGAYEGAGATGVGAVEFNDAMSAGASVGSAAFGGDVVWTAASELVAEIAGAAPGAFDAVSVNGAATLGGTLVVDLLDAGSGAPFAPTEGDAFTLLTAGDINGAFDTVDAPALDGGLEWRLLITAQGVTLRAVTPGVAGDFNYDGSVDAADYTVWRDTLGSSGPLLAADANADSTVDAADFDVWFAAFGGASSQSVPEPSGAALLAFTAVSSVFSSMVARSLRRL